MLPFETRPSLLDRLRDGSNEGAWLEFALRYEDLIAGWCRRSGLQPSDAEDVRQLVMLALLRRMPTFTYDPARGRFRGYLAQVVRNAIRRWHARAPDERVSLDVAELLAEPPAEPEPLEAAWEAEWVDHHYRLALAKVRRSFDEKSARVFEELLAGRSLDEVARDFAMTRPAVQKVKQRVHARLRELVEEQLRDEERLGR